MAAGVPVVVSRIGQLAQVIEEGETGLFFPPGDGAGLAEALERLRGDAALRARLGRAGREWVLQERTWDEVARRILALAGAGEGGGGQAAPPAPAPRAR